MTGYEQATLRDLMGLTNDIYESISLLRSDVMTRFESHDVRIRWVEDEARTAAAIAKERDRNTISKRWVVGVVISVVTVAVSATGIIVGRL